MKKAVIFDCDGVILDSFPQALETLRYVLKKRHNIDIGEESQRLEKIKRLWGLPGDKSVKIMCPEEENFDEWWQDWLKFEKRNLKNITLVKGVKTLLSELRHKNIKTVLATNRSNLTLPSQMERVGLDLNKYFDIVQTTTTEIKGEKQKLNHRRHLESTIQKPNIGSLEKILNILENEYSIKKEEVIYAGDTLIDYMATFLHDIEFVGVLDHGPAMGNYRYFSDRGILPCNLVHTTLEILSRWIDPPAYRFK